MEVNMKNCYTVGPVGTGHVLAYDLHKTNT